MAKMTALVSLLLMPGTASAIGFGVGIRPAYQTTVTQVQDGVYEVSTHGSSAPVLYWCGIGDYAIRTLRTKATQRIYIWRAYEPGVRTVQFSLTPPQGADSSPGYSVTVKRVGANMTAASAQGYCYDSFMDLDF